MQSFYRDHLQYFHKKQEFQILNMLSLSPQQSFNLLKNTIIGPILLQNQCKICLLTQSESDEQLISPCSCIGSMGFIHKSCQKQWIQMNFNKQEQISKEAIFISLSFNCEICKSKIDLRQNTGEYLKFYIYQILMCTMLKKLRFLLFISIVGIIAINYFVFLHFKNLIFKGVKRVNDSLRLFSLISVVVGVLVSQFFVKITMEDSNFILKIMI